MLHSAHKRGVQKGYPLGLEVNKKEVIDQEPNPDFLKDRLPKLDWNCFIVGCRALGIEDIPDELDESLLEDDGFIGKCHHALMEVHVVDGNLICPESKRKFPIRDGIPNMLLREDELPNVDVKDLRTVKSKNEEKESKTEDVVMKSNDTTQSAENTNTAEMKQSNDSPMDTDAPNNGNGQSSASNPYLDPNLMQSLEQFSPKQNEEFVQSHNAKENASNDE